MTSNEADSKTYMYVMLPNHNHAQEVAKVAPVWGRKSAEWHDTASNYMQRTSALDSTTHN